MTTAAELISAAESADWSSFKSLVNAATPGDIAAIGSEWNDVMNSIATGVSGSATAAPKHLFNTAMESFFTAAGDYLTGDNVADALLNIAQSSLFSGIDRLSVEMVAIINAVPPGIALSASSETIGFVLNAVASNQTYNAEVTPGELKSTFVSLMGKFGPLLDVNAVLDTASNIAIQDSYNGTNNFASMKALLDFVPANTEAADPYYLFIITDSIARYQFNPDVTSSQMNSAFKLLVSTYGAQLDVNIVLSVAAQIAQNDGFSGTNNLSSVETLLGAATTGKAFADTYLYQGVLSAIANNQNNTAVTSGELNHAFKVLVANYGNLLDVDTVLNTASQLASNGSYGGVDNLASVETLLSASPNNKANANSFELLNIVFTISYNQLNPEVTPEELNHAFRVLVANYGSLLDVDVILNEAAGLAGTSSWSGIDYLASVETLLGAQPDNKAFASSYVLRDIVSSIANSEYNPSVTPEELNHVFKVLVENYGSQLDVEVVLNVVAQLASDGQLAGVDYLASVETLLGAQPDNKAFASPYVLQDIVISIANNQQNAGVTADELAHTFRVLVANYGAVVDVNVVLNTIVQMAFNDSVNGTDYFSSVNALLGAHPDNAAMADPYNLSNALSMINGNAYNAAITEHELAQTIGKFMTNYGAQMDASDLGFFISDDVGAGAFEAAGAIANHMDATQFTDAASVVDTYSNALLLTTGNDSFDGFASAKVAVYGGAGRDVIDFSANTGSDSRYLDGGAGRDTLIGGLGDDVLVGGRGPDTLTGGGGADTFRFDHLGTHIDHVTDFNAAQGDRIDLHDVLGSEAGLAISDYVHLETSGGNTILSVDKDGTGGANGFVQVAQLDNVTGLDVNDLYANGQIIIG